MPFCCRSRLLPFRLLPSSGTPGRLAAALVTCPQPCCPHFPHISSTSLPWPPLAAPRHPSPCLSVPACPPCSSVTVVKQPLPLPSRVPAVPVVVTAARYSCKRGGAHLYVVFFLPFARLREIRRGPPPPRLPPLHLSVVVLRRLRALPFPRLYVTCVYFSTAVKR